MSPRGDTSPTLPTNNRAIEATVTETACQKERGGRKVPSRRPAIQRTTLSGAEIVERAALSGRIQGSRTQVANASPALKELVYCSCGCARVKRTGYRP